MADPVSFGIIWATVFACAAWMIWLATDEGGE
jgi:hypothetical protein